MAVLPLPRAALNRAAAAAAGLAAVFALAALLADDPPATLSLPLGLPGSAFDLRLDALSAFFATFVFGAGAAILVFAAATSGEAVEVPGNIGLVPIALACFGLAILGADGLTQGTGLALGGGAIGVLGPRDRTAYGPLAVALLAAAALAAAAAAPPSCLLWAALLGPGALAGLAPLHGWLAPAHRGAACAGALLSGITVPVAIYAMLRLLFDPGIPVPPEWWGLPLLLLGAASALAGGLDATRRPHLDTAVAAGTVRQTGLVAIGLGLALTARAADLPAATATALAAVLLLAALQVSCGALLPLIAGSVRAGAGSRQLDRLGGLVHRMPVTAACLGAGLFALAALPPGAGFAGVWMLFHAVLGLSRAGGPGFQLLLCVLIAALGAAAALGASALLRLVGVVCLGRPRTPRAAVAEEPPRAARLALMGLAGVAVGAGVLAGPLLSLLAAAPLRTLTGEGPGGRASWLGLAPGAGAPGYGALPLTVLLVLIAVGVARGRRLRHAPGGSISGPAWADGFAAPPGWLPFGDPATQTAGTGFAPDVFAAGATPTNSPPSLVGGGRGDGVARQTSSDPAPSPRPPPARGGGEAACFGNALTPESDILTPDKGIACAARQAVRAATDVAALAASASAPAVLLILLAGLLGFLALSGAP